MFRGSNKRIWKNDDIRCKIIYDKIDKKNKNIIWEEVLKC